MRKEPCECEKSPRNKVECSATWKDAGKEYETLTNKSPIKETSSCEKSPMNECKKSRVNAKRARERRGLECNLE